MAYVDVVFSGENHGEGLTFVEVETECSECRKNRSIRFGKWVLRSDGYWALRIYLCQDCRHIYYEDQPHLSKG